MTDLLICIDGAKHALMPVMEEFVSLKLMDLSEDGLSKAQAEGSKPTPLRDNYRLQSTFKYMPQFMQVDVLPELTGNNREPISGMSNECAKAILKALADKSIDDAWGNGLGKFYLHIKSTAAR